MFEVLPDLESINTSRSNLTRLGVTPLEGIFSKILRRLRLTRALPVGDHIKSWDVLKTIEYIGANLNQQSPILDIGAFCSEVPVALASLGYSNVHAIDLNPQVKEMPYSNIVKYEIGDFLSTKYQNESFEVMTAISVIEHGYQPEKLFNEINRLLKKDGVFIASFDFWPQKIDTKETKFFDMSWLIFSNQDVQSLLSMAEKYDLKPIGSISSESKDAPIQCLGFDYTFGWLVLRKG